MKNKLDKNILYNEIVDIFREVYYIPLVTDKQDELIKRIVNTMCSKYEYDIKVVEFKMNRRMNQVRKNIENKKKNATFALISDLHQGHSKKTYGILDRFYKKLNKESFDALICAGDWASHSQKQLKSALRHIRRHIKRPIICVLGNHDFWNIQGSKCKSMMWPQILQNHRKLFEEYDIHYLESGSIEIKDVVIAGFDGWYTSFNPSTNDKHWIPRQIEGTPAHMYMHHRAMKSLERVLDVDPKGKKMIIVTHFNPHPDMGSNIKWEKFMVYKADVICYGHSHQEMRLIMSDPQDVFNTCRIFNAGSGYDDPKYIIFSTDENETFEGNKKKK